jgi:glucan 1,3-beta-glucosidase
MHQANSLSPLDGEAASPHDNGEDPDIQNFSKTPVKRTPRSRLLLILAGILIVIVAIVLGTYFGLTRKSSKASAGPSGQNPASPSASATPSNPTSNIVYGGDGTLVTTEQGTTFTYNNSFGGYFVVDSGDPFNNNARAQSWSPPLNQSWRFGTDQILG